MVCDCPTCHTSLFVSIIHVVYDAYLFIFIKKLKSHSICNNIYNITDMPADIAPKIFSIILLIVLFSIYVRYN